MRVCFGVWVYSVYSESECEPCLQGIQHQMCHLCAAAEECRLSQHNNSNSVCRCTVILVLGASAWVYLAQLLSITNNIQGIFFNLNPSYRVSFQRFSKIPFYPVLLAVKFTNEWDQCFMLVSYLKLLSVVCYPRSVDKAKLKCLVLISVWTNSSLLHVKKVTRKCVMRSREQSLTSYLPVLLGLKWQILCKHCSSLCVMVLSWVSTEHSAITRIIMLNPQYN